MKCKINGAGRNESGFLDFSCGYCHEVLSEEEEGKKFCKVLIAKESETTSELYSIMKRQDKLLKEVEQLVIEDVPHQYQERLLKILKS